MGAEKCCLISRDEIARRVAELAEAIGRDYAGRDLVMVGVLKGAFIFLADLVRALPFPVIVDFVRVKSYGAGTESAGEIHITKDVEESLQDRDVLIVEDIIDLGLTLDFLRQHLLSHQPRSLKICCLIDKRERRRGGSPPGLHRLCGGKRLPGGLRPGLRRRQNRTLAGNFCVGKGLRPKSIIRARFRPLRA